jgi:protein-disulfide isomerase
MRLLSVFLAVTLAFAPLAHAKDASAPVTRGEMDGLIRDYLLDHPEVIVDALESMQRKEMEKASEKAAEAVKEHSKVVYDDKMTPVVGEAKAPVTIVEFSDYNCSACKFMFNTLDRVMKEDKGKVRLLVKEFPIFGEQSNELASIGIAAYQVDASKYFAFHSAMMKAPGKADETKVNAALKAAGYDAAKVRERAKADDVRQAIERNHALGQAMGVRGTPTLIVGDEVVPHALDYDGLQEKIAKQAKK